MARNPILPRAGAPLAGAQPPSTEYWRFFDGLSRTAGDSAEQIAELDSRLDALEEGGSTITGQASVNVTGSSEAGYFVSLENDDTAPGPTAYYGTDQDGANGWNHLVSPTYVVVNTKADLPEAVSGVVTLADDTLYLLTGIIDMEGDRIVCGTNNTLAGASANTCGLEFTGGGSDTWITSTSSLSLRYLQLTAATGTLFSLDDASTDVLLWTGIRILDTPTIGTIRDYQNVVWKDQIIFNSANLTLDGTFASFVAETALFDGRSGQTTITVPSTATFTRRFRMLYTAFQVDSGETGINFSSSATVPDESYILDNVSFAGAGTYLAGLDYLSNKSVFFNCTGIVNTSAVCQYYMTGNATATTISGTGTFVKVAGVTTPVSGLTQRFDLTTDNRALYDGASSAAFRLVAFASMTSGNNQTLRIRVAVNGTTLAQSTSSCQTSGSGAASNIGTQTISSLAPGDYIEIFVANDTAANNITVTDLNVTIARL